MVIKLTISSMTLTLLASNWPWPISPNCSRPGVPRVISPEASVVGEIVPAKEFYDYEAKYQLNGPDESLSVIPAKISAADQKRIRAMAILAFRACDCAGLARVDFLMEPATKGEKPAIYLNEINTMPGFTSISMYPKLWQASGLRYSALIDRLIELGLERHREKQDTAFSR